MSFKNRFFLSLVATISITVNTYPAAQADQTQSALTLQVSATDLRRLLDQIPYVVRKHHQPALCGQCAYEWLYRRHYQTRDPLNKIEAQLKLDRNTVLQALALAYATQTITSNPRILELAQEWEIQININPFSKSSEPVCFEILRRNPHNQSMPNLFEFGKGFNLFYKSTKTSRPHK